MESQKEKKDIRRSTQRSALCKINRQAMRWRSNAIVKPLVVKHALCPVRACRCETHWYFALHRYNDYVILRCMKCTTV